MLPIISALLPIIGGVIDRVIPDAVGNERAKLEMERVLVEAATQGQLGQLEVNKIEAGHRSMFVAGWRPAVGWICAAAMAWHFIGVPVATFATAYFGIAAPPLPVFDMSSLMTVLMGMLGLGAMRTYEKKQGLTR
jgi:hypothetical protein